MIDGADCWHYRGKVDQDSYVDMLQKRAKEREDRYIEEVFDDMRRRTSNYELWVEKESYLIRLLKREDHYMMVDHATGEEKSVTGIIINRFYDFNKPISIEPPQLEGN